MYKETQKEGKKKKKAAEEILCLGMKWEAPLFERGPLDYGQCHTSNDGAG